jgi:hypothetical protein
MQQQTSTFEHRRPSPWKEANFFENARGLDFKGKKLHNGIQYESRTYKVTNLANDIQNNTLKTGSRFVATLNLCGNGLTDYDIALIANALETNKHITDLNLSDNDILEVSTIEKLVEVLRQNQSLMNIDIEGNFVTRDYNTQKETFDDWKRRKEAADALYETLDARRAFKESKESVSLVDGWVQDFSSESEEGEEKKDKTSKKGKSEKAGESLQRPVKTKQREIDPSTIRVLDLSCDKLKVFSYDGKQGVEALVAWLPKAQMLEELNLSDNILDVANTDKITASLQGSKTIKVLKLASCGIYTTKTEGKGLWKFIALNNTLTHLDLSNNTELNVGLLMLSVMLKSKASMNLQEINLSNCEITDLLIDKFYENLTKAGNGTILPGLPQTLPSFILEGNKLTYKSLTVVKDLGVIVTLPAPTKPGELTWDLDFSYLKIDGSYQAYPKGSKVSVEITHKFIAKEIRKAMNPGTAVNLANIIIDEAGAKVIAEALWENKNITEIKIGNSNRENYKSFKDIVSGLDNAFRGKKDIIERRLYINDKFDALLSDNIFDQFKQYIEQDIRKQQLALLYKVGTAVATIVGAYVASRSSNPVKAAVAIGNGIVSWKSCDSLGYKFLLTSCAMFKTISSIRDGDTKGAIVSITTFYVNAYQWGATPTNIKNLCKFASGFTRATQSNVNIAGSQDKNIY